MDKISFVVMIVLGGLFTGTVFSLAMDRLPAWRHMDFQPFRDDFKNTLRAADRLQPILLILTIAAAVVFFFHTSNASKVLALAAAIGFFITLILSLAILVPVQNRISAASKHSEEFDRMRRSWMQGHTGRTVLSLLSYVLLAFAVALH